MKVLNFINFRSPSLGATAGLALFLLLPLVSVWAQAVPDPAKWDDENLRPSAEKPFAAPGFRVEKVSVAAGAEVVTIFADQGTKKGIPLVSILRDTLGDANPDNDRLRYVWLHTFTRPSRMQKMAALVPFLYARTTNKTDIGDDPPPVVIDIQKSDKAVWNQVFWTVFKKLVINEFGFGARAVTSQYRQNVSDYRKTAVAGALTVLSLYQEIAREKVLSDRELKDIQARLTLSDKTFGWHMKNESLERVFEKELTNSRDYRGHNWELLRQYAEAQDLYFEPLLMPDGTARHAIVWTTVSDLAANRGKKFDRRFLNIKNPWTDPNLAEWKGYAQVRWMDSDDREVEPETPGATPKTFIPLALYGLDNPKIPMILVDFRDKHNPKFREMSKRVFTDITTNILALSPFSSVPYFVGRYLFGFIPGRRGMDFNQASRLRSYAQLKLLLLLDASIDREFSNDIANRVEHATLNPLENDSEVESRLAFLQYKNLMAYVERPDGLSAKISDDRREEMVRLKHGWQDRAFFSLAHVATFGAFTHREKATTELLAQLDERRQLDYHERYLRELAFTSTNPEVDSNISQLRRSLSFVAQNGADAEAKTTKALARIFAISKNDDLQTLCLSGLYRINNSSAKKELLSIYRNSLVDIRWRDVCAQYLKRALQEGQRISKADLPEIEGIAENTGN